MLLLYLLRYIEFFFVRALRCRRVIEKTRRPRQPRRIRRPPRVLARSRDGNLAGNPAV